MAKHALVTGFTGQDGRYLSRHLLSLGYEVDGMFRRISHPDWTFVHTLGLEKVRLIQGDLSDGQSLRDIIKDGQYDEIYNLAAMSHVGTSFKQPEYTIEVSGLGVVRLLEQIRLFSKHTRLYQASSSECYGKVDCILDESVKFEGRSPYGAAKILAHNMCKIYRDAYDMFICCGILFNHSSESRGVDFASKKITDYVARFHLGATSEPLKMGYIYSKRDEGYSPEFCEAMHLMLQQDTPDDYVIATGESHTIKEFIEAAFSRIGIVVRWDGVGLDERGYNTEDGQLLVTIDPNLYRPCEVPLLQGDYSKAKNKFGWEPKIKFKELMNLMVDYDIKKYKHVLSP